MFFSWKSKFFKLAPKKPDFWATFVRTFATKNCQKTPNTPGHTGYQQQLIWRSRRRVHYQCSSCHKIGCCRRWRRRVWDQLLKLKSLNFVTVIYHRRPACQCDLIGIFWKILGNKLYYKSSPNTLQLFGLF